MILVPQKEAQSWRRRVCDLFDRNGVRIIERRFPGAQPISFVKANKNALLEQDYFVSEKSDGTRYLLFIADFENAFLVNPLTALYLI
jgi:mRNA guanylyltransferase